MITFLQIIHILLCLLLIVLILIQSGKGQGLAGAFGSFAGNAAQNLFGARTTDILTKVTAWLAAIYFISTITVAVLQINASTSVMSNMNNIPAVEKPSATPTKEASEAKNKLKEITGKLISGKKDVAEKEDNNTAEKSTAAVKKVEENIPQDSENSNK